MNLNPSLSSKPMLVLIISWLMIFFGVGMIIYFFFAGFLGTFATDYVGLSPLLKTVLQMLLPGIILISVGKGLKNMKKWVLYVLPIMLLGSLCLTFGDITNGNFVFLTILLVLPTIYSWTHRSLFS